MSTDKAHREGRPVVFLFSVNIKCGLNFFGFHEPVVFSAQPGKKKQDIKTKKCFDRLNNIVGFHQYVFLKPDHTQNHVTVLI